MKHSPEFWQRLLAAELQNAKAAHVASSAPSPPGDAEWLLTTNLLSQSERQRARQADLSAMERVLAQGVSILEPDNYPPGLDPASHHPPALFTWGDTDCLHRPCVAIVGTRAATTYGKAAAQKFGEELARAGVTVVSGGALGIDAAAHKGALAAGGHTVAVLLTAIERVYPRVHFGLFEQIKASGCLISQFAIGTTSSRDFRPLIRNHTVAGLAQAVIVIEAPERSGALSTARFALEKGREVFVVPANIDNVNFRGSHALIRDGATLVDHPDQVLAALGLEPRQKITESAPATELQNKILGVLTSDPLQAEFIVERTGLEASEVLSELTMLELEGRVIRDTGGYALRP